MRSRGDLRITLAVGDAPRLGLPIPELATVSLPAITAARVQEWLVFDDDDAGSFTLCGHRFRILSWVDSDSALLVAYVGPSVA